MNNTIVHTSVHTTLTYPSLYLLTLHRRVAELTEISGQPGMVKIGSRVQPHSCWWREVASLLYKAMRATSIHRTCGGAGAHSVLLQLGHFTELILAASPADPVTYRSHSSRHLTWR